MTLGVGYSLCAGIGRTSSLPLCVSLSTFPTLRLYMARLFSFLSTFAQVTLRPTRSRPFHAEWTRLKNPLHHYRASFAFASHFETVYELFSLDSPIVIIIETLR